MTWPSNASSASACARSKLRHRDRTRPARTRRWTCNQRSGRAAARPDSRENANRRSRWRAAHVTASATSSYAYARPRGGMSRSKRNAISASMPSSGTASEATRTPVRRSAIATARRAPAAIRRRADFPAADRFAEPQRRRRLDRMRLRQRHRTAVFRKGVEARVRRAASQQDPTASVIAPGVIAVKPTRRRCPRRPFASHADEGAASPKAPSTRRGRTAGECLRRLSLRADTHVADAIHQHDRTAPRTRTPENRRSHTAYNPRATPARYSARDSATAVECT